MQEKNGGLKGAAIGIGTWMFMVGTLIMGPVGLVLLCVAAYAMHVSNLALIIVCALLLSSPLVLMVIWAPLLGASLIAERSAERAEVTANANSIP